MHTIILALHVIGSGLMFGVVFFSFMIVMKKVIDPSKLALLKNIYVFGTVGAIWQVITGLILYFQEPDEFKTSNIFWIKMGLFVLDGIIALAIIDRRIKSATSPQTKDDVNFMNTYLWSLLSLLIILSVVTLGVFLVEG